MGPWGSESRFSCPNGILGVKKTHSVQTEVKVGRIRSNPAYSSFPSQGGWPLLYSSPGREDRHLDPENLEGWPRVPKSWWRKTRLSSPSLLSDQANIGGAQTWSPDGSRFLTFSDNEAVIWWAEPAEVAAAARASFQTCLDPEIRENTFEEPPREAWERYLACERSYGRRPPASR